jgi:hypothetical protein
MSNNGSIMELVAKGAQDEELIDINNKTSIFDYSIEKKNKYAKGDTIFYPVGKANWGNTVRFNIERKGDLLYGLYLVIRLPKLSIENIVEINPKPNANDPDSLYRLKYADYIGDVLIEKISLYFNGQLIDEQYGDYMQLYTDLYISDWNRKAMLGLDDYLNLPNLKINPEYIYIPLNFWFCNDIEAPLPIISMQNTEIYIDVKFRKFSECYTILQKDNSGNSGLYFQQNLTHPEVPLEEVKLQANFYYLDLEERRVMAEKEWSIMITQAQKRVTELKNSTILEIDFNHVVKDLIFYLRPTKHKIYGDFFNFTAKSSYPPVELFNQLTKPNLWLLEPKRHLLSRARILFNGIERVEWRDAKYFYNMQNYENYQNTIKTHVYLYSFNVDPTRFSNNNGCNFSRLDNAQLQVEVQQNPFVVNYNPNVTYPLYDNFELVCYATNFNILVIKGGLAGVRYSN